MFTGDSKARSSFLAAFCCFGVRRTTDRELSLSALDPAGSFSLSSAMVCRDCGGNGVKGVFQGFWATPASSLPVLPQSVLTEPFFETLPPHQTLLLLGSPTSQKVLIRMLNVVSILLPVAGGRWFCPSVVTL